MIKKIYFIIAMFILALVSCAQQQSLKEISPADAYQFQKQQKAVILDVREENETIIGRVKDSVLLPMSLMNNDRSAFNKKIEELKKYPVVILYCHSGRRAGIVGLELEKAGLKVFNLGGFEEWKQNQLPTQ